MPEWLSLQMERFILAHSLEILVHGLVGLLFGVCGGTACSDEQVYGETTYNDGQVCGGKSITGKNFSPLREDWEEPQDVLWRDPQYHKPLTWPHLLRFSSFPKGTMLEPSSLKHGPLGDILDTNHSPCQHCHTGQQTSTQVALAYFLLLWQMPWPKGT